MYYRAVSSAGAYEKVTAAGGARALTLTHLAPDTSYDIKLQAYTAQAASEFSAIKVYFVCYFHFKVGRAY